MTQQNKSTAYELAKQKIDSIANSVGRQFAIMSEYTVETEKGWVFFYNSVEFIESKDPSAQLVGNGPILVTREGAIHVLPSAIPWEMAIDKL